MRRIAFLGALLILVLCARTPAWAQFDPDRDQIKTSAPDTTHYSVSDTTSGDSVKSDTTRAVVPKVSPENLDTEEASATAPKSDEAIKGVVTQANTWVRRLLYRGVLNATHIGAYAQYQITAWDEAVGSFGPVEGKIAVYYLGTTDWMGKDAEWLQVVYQTVDEEPTVVYYDLLVPSSMSIKKIYRALYRVGDDQLKAANFVLPADQMDYDALDKPSEEGVETVNLYSGKYDAQKYRGVGSDAAIVVIYSSKDVPPLGIVRLGYGDVGVTLTSKGFDAEPRFSVPAPPSTSSPSGQ